MFRRTILLLTAVLLASVFLSYAPVHAGKPAPPPPPAGPRFSLYWVADKSVYWDPATGDWAEEVIKWSQPRGMNDSGDIVGLACWDVRTGMPDPDESGENWEVFLYTEADGVARNLNDVVADVLPEYWRLIDAGDINNRGQIVGNAEYRWDELLFDDQGEPVWDETDKQAVIVHQAWGAFFYTPPDVAESEDLPVLEILDDLRCFNPRSINDSGVAVLEWTTETGTYPAVYNVGWVLPLRVPAPSGGPGVWRENAINSSGQIAGNGRIGDYTNAVRFTPSLDPNDAFNVGVTVSLGWLKNPGRTPIGQANDINDNGQVTGWTTTGGGNAGHAFRYTDGTGMKDLGTLGSSNTKGYGINNLGDVVGDAIDSGRAFLYTDTSGMVDLTAATDFANWPEYSQMQLQPRRITGNDNLISPAYQRRWILGALGGERGHACLLVPK